MERDYQIEQELKEEITHLLVGYWSAFQGKSRQEGDI